MRMLCSLLKTSFVDVFSERRAGTLKAQLFVGGKVLGSEDLEYASPLMDAITGLHLIYIRQLNELCSFINESRLLTADIDKRMSRVLRDESDDLIPVAAFEYFHGVHRFQSAGKWCRCPAATNLFLPFVVLDLVMGRTTLTGRVAANSQMAVFIYATMSKTARVFIVIDVSDELRPKLS